VTRLLVTRPLAQARPWVLELQAAGCDAVALPLLAIAPTGKPAAVVQAWQQLSTLAFVMFVSGNAVHHFFGLQPPGCPWPGALSAGATGPGTARALLEVGVPQAQVVMPVAGPPGAGPHGAEAERVWDAEALWARISTRAWAGEQVMVVRGEQGRDWLAEQWRQAGATVHFVEAYQRQRPLWGAAEQAALQAALTLPQQHLWLFSSSEAVLNLQALAPGVDWRPSAALATHPRIVQAVQAAGFGQVRLTGPELPAVLQAVRDAG
jgi:uroporphyrinogen-III synthase